jgi:hypothetical protein
MYIDESFVSFIWQHCYFNTPSLKTTRNEIILIKHPGHANIHAGPDFIESKIKIGDVDWVGSVEIHVKSSHWNSHDHSSNPDYNKVILHVVWKHDIEVWRNDGSLIPTLEVHNKVSHELLDKYNNLIYGESRFPCHPHLVHVKNISVLSMIEKSMILRMENKTLDIFRIFNDTGKNWEETAYRILSRNFGFKVNQENMYLLSKFIPYSIISRHRKNILQSEALLFGMAGFLADPCDSYSEKLKSEYMYLMHKYSLSNSFLKRYHWRFLRLRPQNFPTIRMAQLAVVLGNLDKIFSTIIEFDSVKKTIELLKIKQSAYWLEHYDFGRKYKKQISGLGVSSIRNILTNTFVPILTAYAKHINNDHYLFKAIKILEAIPAENNHILNNWMKRGIKPFNSFESQGLIELSNSYCCKKKCLICTIGTDILLK